MTKRKKSVQKKERDHYHKPKTHFDHEGGPLCKIQNADGEFLLTKNGKKVTCRLCERVILVEVGK